VQQKLKTTKFSMDTWFTGGDFANEAIVSDSDGCSPQDSSHLLLVFLYLFVVILSVLGAVASLCFTWKLSPSQVWFRPGLEDWPCMRYCKTFTEVSWMISGQ
jgi:hypothetical protein